MSKKPIIVFEGIEGSGKSYHINNVANFLKKKNISFIKLREPGGNKNSEKIRSLILNNKSNFNKNTDLLLYLSARSENIEFIKNNIGKKIILIDRFVDSTIAYQHYGQGIDIKFINFINTFLLKKINITFTFLNLVNENNMKQRLSKRKILNRYDKFNKNFYKKVQDGFLKIQKKNPGKYMKINSNKDIEENKKIILNKINKLI
ncbi:dTMP kinase [Candidatus Pelagibacter sp.]|nr:dTMP kinase [Candidatus Pelagibacter sp.]